MFKFCTEPVVLTARQKRIYENLAELRMPLVISLIISFALSFFGFISQVIAESTTDFSLESCQSPPPPFKAQDRSIENFLPHSFSESGLTLCGAPSEGAFQVGVILHNGSCSLGTEGAVVYKSFSGKELNKFLPSAKVRNASSRTNREDAHQTAWDEIAQQLANQVREDAADTNRQLCENPDPVTGCELPAITCCQAHGSGEGNSGNGDEDGNPGGGSSGPPGGASGFINGGSGDPDTTVGEFELLFVRKPHESSFLILETSARNRATAADPFGICTSTGSGGSAGSANVNPGALKSEGCPDGYQWHKYTDFIGNMAVAGIAIAVPFAAPYIAPALTIPGVAVGAAVVVGGYLLYRWLSAPTPHELISNVIVSCENLCAVTTAATLTTVVTAVDAISALWVKVHPGKLVKDAVERIWRQTDEPPSQRDNCCELVCAAALMGNPGCYGHCFEQCSYHANDCVEAFWYTLIPGACGKAGRYAALACIGYDIIF